MKVMLDLNVMLDVFQLRTKTNLQSSNVLPCQPQTKTTQWLINFHSRG